MTRLIRTVTTTGSILLVLGLIGGCASSAAQSPGATKSPSAATTACSRLPLHAIATAIGTPRLVNSFANPLTSKSTVCGLSLPGNRQGSIINVILGLPGSDAHFNGQVKYFRSTKGFRIVLRTLTYGRMLYVTSTDKKTAGQSLTLYAQGHEYVVQSGLMASKPFSDTQLLRVAHLLIGV